MNVKSSSIDSDYVDLVNESSDSDSDEERHDGNVWSSSVDIASISHSGVPQVGKKLGSVASASWSSSVSVASWGSSSLSAAPMEPLVNMPGSAGGSSTNPAPASIGQKRARSHVDDDASAAPGSDRGALKKRRGKAGEDGTEEKEGHECEVCGKVLSSTWNLRQHVSVVHLGERKHQCTVCGKRFGKAGTLKKHMTTVHLGERNHECSVCDKRFGEAGHLKRHVRTVHLGERNHECSVCGKRFGQAGDLKQHIVRLH